jgi:uncharacterized glyoxalase superfamily metalloenzyme YdcJ
VPQYGTLVALVAQINAACLTRDCALKDSLERTGEIERLDIERHGAIRLGTAAELCTMRRLFAVMGMFPVGYYDLSSAGVPVYSTAFRPIDEAALRHNPFRMFTSLLRLDLIDDVDLRAQAEAALANRRIFTPGAIALIEIFEREGGLTREQADDFVAQALETFRWRSEAMIDLNNYQKLNRTHRLIADIVGFKGPHINHLTPRTLDIDAVQTAMPQAGIVPKAYIEGPPHRACGILLRQTSFKALEEKIAFPNADGGLDNGTHTARFGEIEQRGVALTPKGRQLYDETLAAAQSAASESGAPETATYQQILAERFQSFPDDWMTLRAEGLAYFRYAATEAGRMAAGSVEQGISVTQLIEKGLLTFDPIIYEDFLPVSAAGIFQSNLGQTQQRHYAERANRASFETALGGTVANEFDLYHATEAASLKKSFRALRLS